MAAAPRLPVCRESLIAFEGVAGIVAFRNCPEVVAILPKIMPGWRFWWVGLSAEAPIATLTGADGGYRIELAGEPEPAWEETAVGAVCSFVVDLAAAHIDQDRERLCLHCAAVELGGALAVFPAAGRAGKSTLTARLAAGGACVYADDLLPLAAGLDAGMALGIAPRLRRPLPRGAGALLESFVARHSGPADEDYLYLSLPGGRLAPFGRSQAIGGFVLLDRRDAGPARLARAENGAAALRLLVAQNVAREMPAGEILDRSEGLAARYPVLVLTYSDLDEAARLMEKTFAKGWEAALRCLANSALVPAPTFTPEWTVNGAATAGSLPGEGCLYRRRSGIETRERDGTAFLVDEDNAAIFALDPVGAAVWELLSDPIGLDETVMLLHQATGVDQAVLARDVAGLFSALEEADLVGREENVRKSLNPS